MTKRGLFEECFDGNHAECPVTAPGAICTCEGHTIVIEPSDGRAPYTLSNAKEGSRHTVTLSYERREMLIATCTCGWMAGRRSRIGIDEAIEKHSADSDKEDSR